MSLKSSFEVPVTAFSPDGATLAVAGGDGRIKTWDVASGQMRAELADSVQLGSSAEEEGHLAVQYTALVWVKSSSVSAESKGKKKKGSKSHLLIVGTAVGDVLAWDPALGQVRWRAPLCHSGKVVSVVGTPNGGHAYSAGVDGQVAQLDVATGSVLEKFRAAKKGLSSVAVSPDGGSLLVAGAGLRLLDLVSHKRIRKFAGHPGVVRALAFSARGDYVMSAAEGDRQMALWESSTSSKEEEGQGAAALLGMEDPAATVSCSGRESEDVVVAVSESGEMYVWHGGSVAAIRSCTPIRIRVAKVGKIPRGILAGLLSPPAEDGSITVQIARGSVARPHFERLTLDKSTASIVLGEGEEAAGELLPSVPIQKQETATGPVTVLGPESMPMPAAQLKAVDASKQKKKRPVSVREEEASGPPAAGQEVKEEQAEEMEVEGEGEETLADRLKALGLAPPTEDEAESKDAPALLRPGAPRADSLQVLLSQALQANDRDLITRCISIVDEKLIANTVRRLAPTVAAKLLTVAVSRLQSRPNHATTLVAWLRAVLLHHASWLMSAPSAQPALCSLHQLIDARVSVLKPMLALQGRLDLVLAQMAAVKGIKEEGMEGLPPAAVYEEVDSEDEDVEDVGGESDGSGKDEWETDEENGNDGDGTDSLDGLSEEDDL